MHARLVRAAIPLFVLASVTSAVAIASAAGDRTDRPPRPVGRYVPSDTGAGELLVVVHGGVYPTRAEATAAARAMTFGDVQGYFVAPVGQFDGFRSQVGVPGEFALVTAFRTQEGADAFVEFARALGYPATVLPERTRSLGGLYAGLGQEAHPDGSGPLLGPIDESLP